jgi:glycosyltransferase involved in cell wall biosynthesis
VSNPDERPLKIAVYTIALNEAAHVDRWARSAAEADYRIVADTGSQDDTIARLEEAGVTVHRIAIRPWRFDDARNAALALVPADVDVCITMDMDEFLEPGWRPKLEAAWTPGTTAIWCQMARLSHLEDKAPRRSRAKKIHARWGYRCKRAVHETLCFTGKEEVTRECNEIVIAELQDRSKTTRQQYLPLLELAHAEDPGDAQICFWLARDLMWADRSERAREMFEEYLALPTSTWKDERAEAMRYLARMQPGEKLPWLEKARMEAPHRREVWLDLAEELHNKADWLNLFWACANGVENTRGTGSYLDDPHSWGFRLYDLGAIASWHLNAMDRAVEWGQKALDLDPDNQRLKDNLDFFVRRQGESRGKPDAGATFWRASLSRREELNQAVVDHTRSTVVSGLFKDMRIATASSWGDGDISPKLLGTYEQELQVPLQRMLSKPFGAIVNVGCAEGYYAVGLARLKHDVRVYAFDTDAHAQQRCRSAAQLNGVADRVVVRGSCSTKDLESLTTSHSRLLCIVDCEGYELELLTPEFIQRSGYNSDFIIECHDFLAPAATDTLQLRFENTHDITLIQPGARNPNVFDFLSDYGDMERWLVVSEMRPCIMNYLICEAKSA